MSESLKLIIFDLDNTLFPFNDLWLKANKQTFEEYTLLKGIDYNDFMSLYSKYDLQFWEKHDSGLITLDELRELRLIKTLQHFDINISHKKAREYFKMFFSKLLSNITVNPKINNSLLQLKERVKIAILTNGKSKEQIFKINNLDINMIFEDNIFISQDIGFEKPDSNAFLAVTNKLNVLPKECLFIGDSYKNDILGALNVGMSAIFLNNYDTNIETDEKDKLYVFDDGISNLLEKLLNNDYQDINF